MAKGGPKSKYGESGGRLMEDSVDRHDHRPKKKQNKLIDPDFAKKFPIPPPMIPPGFNPMIPPVNPGKGVPMIVPGMPLPPPLLMNMPLPPPDSDPEEIKKALMMIMSNFPVPAPKDARHPFPLIHKPQPVRKKHRREHAGDSSASTIEGIVEREIDKRLADLDTQEDTMTSRLVQIPGLLIKRHLKKSTIDDIERASQKRKLKIKFIDSLDSGKHESKLHTTYCSASLEMVYKLYQSLGLGKVEGVLPFMDGLE